MSDVPPPPRHAFNHAPAVLRIFRFAADSAPRILELAHVSAFLRECAVEFGSADATLPGAMRCEFAAKRFFMLRSLVERNAAHCPWLAVKLLACRSGVPMPAAALAPDVTRHDVNWGAKGARRHADLQLTHDGFGLTLSETIGKWRWAQGVTSGKHFFEVCVTAPGGGYLTVGWVDDNVSHRPQSRAPRLLSTFFSAVGRRCTHSCFATLFAVPFSWLCLAGCLVLLGQKAASDRRSTVSAPHRKSRVTGPTTHRRPL
jgi:hypothetical protein